MKLVGCCFAGNNRCKHTPLTDNNSQLVHMIIIIRGYCLVATINLRGWNRFGNANSIPVAHIALIVTHIAHIVTHIAHIAHIAHIGHIAHIAHTAHIAHILIQLIQII